jgi:CubicO group peptidase (beta-lactamase class C family)
MNFLLGVADNGTYDEVLSRRTLQEMWTPGFPTDDLEGPEFRERIAMPFFVIDFDRAGHTTRYVGHTGSQQGFRSFFYVQPESRSAVVWVVNSRPRENFRPMVRAQRLKAFNGLFPLFGA